MVTHYRDGGFASRKLWLVLFSMALLSGVALSAKFIPGIDAVFPTLCGSVTALAALYIGGNTATKFVAGNHAVAIANGPNKAPPPPEEPAVGL